MRSLFPIGVVLLILLAIPGVAVFTADLLGYERDINAWLESTLSISHRLAVALPAAIALFCVPPAIILLYFLRLRRKPVTVSSTYLWKKSIEDLHVNRLMQWLRRNILLLMQLLASLMMIYAVMGPRLHGSVIGGKHYILLIDNSASMSAIDVKPTRLAWAKQQALREIDAATDDDSGMVIVFNSTAEILQSYTNNRGELRAAVNRIQASQKPTRIDEALSLAASLANPQKSTENESAAPAGAEPGKERQYVPTEGIPADVHLFSDGRFPTPEFALTNLTVIYHVPDEGGSANLAITKLSVDRGWQKPNPLDNEDEPGDTTTTMPTVAERDADDPTKVTVTAMVRNYREQSIDTPLTIRLEVLNAKGELQRSYARKIRPAAKKDQAALGKAVQFFLPDVPEGAEITLKARIESANDSLPLDDEAFAVLGIARRAKVLIVTPDQNFLLRAFFDSPAHKELCDTTWEIPANLANPAKYLTPVREGKYDLVIFDRCAPPSEDQMPNANTLFFGHPPPPFKLPSGMPTEWDVKAEKAPSVQGSQDRHPIMRSLRGLYDIAIDESYRLPKLPDGTQKLLEAAGGQLLIAGIPRAAFLDVAVAFQLLAGEGKWNTTWPLEPSFVLFLRNCVTNLGGVRDAAAEEPTQPGQEKPLRTGVVKSVSVTLPDGSTKTFDRDARPDFTFTGTDVVGAYAASWTEPGTDRTFVQRFAVNLFPSSDHDESDIKPASEVTIGAETIKPGETRKQPRDLWKLAVVVGLLVLMGEWWVYNRRVQI
jgi:von Willebrand factor type A domain/Aerotolerance regulator N-terminal